MEFLDTNELRKILNLKGSDLIQPVIAERQLEVIRKGFNFLHQPENNALYIADEVGLGKTYIALGIASLMRHFTAKPEAYQDVILVPKENLQKKWSKEIRQFTHNNYLQLDNRVKSVIGHSVGSILLKDSLEPINTDVPAYHIFRNSSFSFGLKYNSPNELRKLLLSRLKEESAIEYFYEAENKGYLYAHNKILLKRFYAYLLSINNPEIELLIVDEGHNFKYGLGDSDQDVVSDRNNVVSRFFGIIKQAEEDKRIFGDFPDLKRLIKPKVEKLIVLSATPKTNSLLELKKQFDCFLPSHILTNCKTEKDIEDKLTHFLIRGKMEYELGGKFYSRNQCREEHRNGNVEKRKDAKGLQIKDNVQSLVMGLLQYNTIKNLNAKHNATFELGMLAGFETFRIDQQRRIEENEFEETRTSKIRTSQDEDILGGIINSYKEEFGVLPPHPKQDAIVDAIFNQMKNGEKSLVFVRRVASAYELERRLLDKWEKEVIYEELKSKWKNLMVSEELDSLLIAYEDYQENRTVNEKLESIFSEVISRLISLPKVYPLEDQSGNMYKEESIRIALYYVYNNYKFLSNGQQFYNFLLKQVSLSNFKMDFLEEAYQLILKTQAQWTKLIGKENESQFDDDEDESYFFHSFFRQPSNKYFRKSRIYQADWFDLNYYLLNNHFGITAFELAPLKKGGIHNKPKDASDMKEVQEMFLKHIKEEEFKELKIFEEDYPAALVSKKTLITELLINVFEKEFLGFLKRMSDKSKRKIEIIHEIKTLVTIVKSTIRNGIGFLPLYIADNAKNGDVSKNYIKIISDTNSCFYSIVTEIRAIINDYELLQAVNFPEKDNQRNIENKLTFQSPVKGMSGIKKNKEKVATQFRMPGYPYVLVTTDIFREGEDLHTYCQNIYHYGIAWNCSDMEQRTGRIDRINSLSNRLMVRKQRNDFEERIHVFCPYLEKTLEVNQVNKLFTSLNNFTQAFDIVDAIEEDGIASVKSSIEQMPVKLDVYQKSKFEHNNFKGYVERGRSLVAKPMIGNSGAQIEALLNKVLKVIHESGTFHFIPELIFEEFKIIGDYDLVGRKNRRGPFRILIKNDLIPGYFKIEISSYLFKASSKVQRAYRESITSEMTAYSMIDIDDYHAFALSYSLNELDISKLVKDLLKMVEIADEWEEDITKGQDTVIFG